jgi:hypothetical protein
MNKSNDKIEISPKHLDEKAFINVVTQFRDTRVKLKHTSDDNES